MTGWIALHRGWRDCDVFADDEPMSEREAWVWLIENAAWKATVRRNAKGERVEVRRGQYHTSLRTLGTVFGWSKSKVDRYLARLVAADMIETVSGQSGVLITICNYEKFQSVSEPEKVVPETATGQSWDTQEQRKQDSLPNGRVASDPVKMIFDIGVSMLVEAGSDQRQARSIIGKWRKGFTDSQVLEGLMDCQARRISNPVEWMPRRLAVAKPASQAEILRQQAKRYTSR